MSILFYLCWIYSYGSESLFLFFGRVGNYVAESREEGDYDAEFKNLGKLVTDLQNQILYKVAEGLKPVPPRTQSR